jgi:hypothetical protein
MIADTAAAELQRRIQVARDACQGVGIDPDQSPFNFDDERFTITPLRGAPARPD